MELKIREMKRGGGESSGFLREVSSFLLLVVVERERRGLFEGGVSERQR